MATFRKHGRGYQLIYQVDGQRHFETIYAKNDTEAERELGIRMGQALEGRAPTSAARQLRFEDLAAGLESEYKARGRKSGDTLKWRLGNLKRHFGGRHALSITSVACCNSAYLRTHDRSLMRNDLRRSLPAKSGEAR